MNEKKASPTFRVLKRILKALYPRMEVEGAENLPDEPVVFVGNHSQMHGPIVWELYPPVERYTWCASQMMRLKEVPGYAFQDFWSEKPRRSHWLYRILSYLIAPLSVLVFNNANTIPVYRDARMLNTFRETIARLEAGSSVVIFPERNEKYNRILYQFQQGFVDVARPYYRKTGKKLAFVPVYIAPKLRKMTLGKPVYFNPDNPMPEERGRICEALMKEITGMACAMPRHIVVPYRNIPKKDYPFNIPDEVTSYEATGG